MNTHNFRNRSILRIFFSYFRPHGKLFALDLLCATVVALIDLSFPLATRHALHTLLPAARYRDFFVLMCCVLAAFAVRALLFYVIAYWGHTFGIRVEADIRRDLFVHMQELPQAFFDRNRTGQLMSRLTSDLFEITELAHHGPEDLLISCLTICGALGIMFSIEWRLALAILLMLPLFLLVVLHNRRSMGSSSRGEKRKAAEINAEIESSLSGMRTMRAFANESAALAKFDVVNEKFKLSKRAFHHAMGIFNASMEFFLTLLSVAVIAIGGYLVMQAHMDLVDLITFSLYITTFISPVRKLANFSEMFVKGFAGLERFAALMRTEPTLCDAPDAVALGDVRGEIDCRHVSFSYDGAIGVLHDLQLHIAPHETIAIVGPSGGGKSTLCQLIPRFYDVSDGAVCIDGQDVRSLTQQSLRRSIGIVQQDVFLFAASVRENIRYGRPDASDEEVEEAARRAEIYEDIIAMPEGFDSNVGERGTLLSGGQKQRISIARIFLKNPPILILDEATSALDSITEVKIQSAFEELSRGRTTIIIAHRLSTVRNADRILVIEDGRIREEGTHQQLMERNGVYAALSRAQSEVSHG